MIENKSDHVGKKNLSPSVPLAWEAGKQNRTYMNFHLSSPLLLQLHLPQWKLFLTFPDLTLVLLPDQWSSCGLSFGKMPPCCSLFLISSSAAMLVPLGQPTLLFSAFFLSSSAAMSAWLEQPRFLLLFFQRFILGCLSLSFSSCLFLPVLLNYLFPYLFICGTVKVIQISSIFNSKRVHEISQYNYF